MGRSGKKNKQKPKKKFSIFNLILVLIMLTGGGIIAYPSFSDWWNSARQSRVISDYREVVEKVDETGIQEAFDKAQEFNEYLETLGAARWNITDNPETMEWYNSTMNVTDKGIIGFIEIPNYSGEQPIYHGTTDEVLQVAIGHLEGSSFTTGEIGTHAAYIGHDGLPSARLFTDITKMVKGDTFVIHAYNRTFTYQVDQIETVLPDDFSQLELDENEELCTLITCVPYGVNSHRLMVRGHRVKNKVEITETEEPVVTATESDPVDLHLLYAGVGLLGLLLILIILLISELRKQKKIKQRRAERRKNEKNT